MTAPATTRRAGPFNGNGATTSFPFTFKVFATSDISVVKTSTAGLDTTMALGADYSVTLNSDQDATPGGSITYPISGTALALGEKLTAVGALPYDQTADLPTGGNYRAVVVENALDRTVMQVQQVAEGLGRALTLPVSAAGADTELPSPEAGKVIAWNSTGTGLVNVDSADLASTVVAGTAYTDVFDGTGAQTAFALSADPGGVNALDVAISGVSQVNGVDFAVSGTTLTFTAAPASGTGNIAVRYVAALPIGTVDAGDASYIADSAGAVATTVQEKLRETVSSSDFGAVGDGVTNDTAALGAFLAACAGGKRGVWEAGVFSVDEGVLLIQPSANVHTPGVEITTAGYKATILKPRGTTEAPVLTIQNLTQVSAAGRFMKGGTLGGIGFDGTGQPGGWSASHALSLRGVDGWRFGFLHGDSLRGDLLHIPQNLYAGNNPDPYHVAFCVFDGLQSNFGNGWTLNNDNFVGFTSNEVLNVACYGASTGSGAIRSCGAGNIYRKISVGTCYGWAIDIYDGAAGGRASREHFEILELDDPEYGIRVQNLDQSVIEKCRIVHRYHGGIGYWPREALRLSDTSANVTNCTFDIVHRIESGGVKADLGGFLRCQSSTQITGTRVVYKINDNAGFGLTNADILSGASINSGATLRLETSIADDRTVAFDSLAKPMFFAEVTAATIVSGGFGAIGSKVGATTEVYDRRANYDAANSKYTVPVTGLYAVSINLSVTGGGAGTRVRFGVFNETAAQLVKWFEGRTIDATKHVFNGSAELWLTAGDVVSLNADNSSGGALTVSTTISRQAENSWAMVLREAGC